MKRVLLIYMLVLTPLLGLAQARLAIDTGTLVIAPLHPRIKDTLKVSAYVKNIGNATFKGYLLLSAKIKISKKAIDSSAPVFDTTLSPGKSRQLNIEHITLNDTFREGN